MRALPLEESGYRAGKRRRWYGVGSGSVPIVSPQGRDHFCGEQAVMPAATLAHRPDEIVRAYQRPEADAGAGKIIVTVQRKDQP